MKPIGGSAFAGGCGATRNRKRHNRQNESAEHIRSFVIAGVPAAFRDRPTMPDHTDSAFSKRSATYADTMRLVIGKWSRL